MQSAVPRNWHLARNSCVFHAHWNRPTVGLVNTIWWPLKKCAPFMCRHICSHWVLSVFAKFRPVRWRLIKTRSRCVTRWFDDLFQQHIIHYAAIYSQIFRCLCKQKRTHTHRLALKIHPEADAHETTCLCLHHNYLTRCVYKWFLIDTLSIFALSYARFVERLPSFSDWSIFETVFKANY